MDYDKLSRFIRKEMRMTHIYQPIMIRTLLEADSNTATADDIARDIVSVDPILLEYYKGRVRVWPHKTLLKHKIVSHKRGGVYALRLDRPLTREESKKLAEMCELRLQEFIDKDPAIKRMRALNDGPIPGSMRYDVLARSKGVCVGCGTKSSEAKLHVDHITPRSRNGRTILENLQALCGPCNTAKRDRDETDFLKWQKRLQFRRPGCQLCSSSTPEPPIMDNAMARAIRVGAIKGGGNPDTVSRLGPRERKEGGGAPAAAREEGRPILVHPKRHVSTLIDMIPAERSMCLNLVDSILAGLTPGDAGGRGGRGAKRPVVRFDPAAGSDDQSLQLLSSSPNAPSLRHHHYSIVITPP